jgi:hypothetical protein
MKENETMGMRKGVERKEMKKKRGGNIQKAQNGVNN